MSKQSVSKRLKIYVVPAHPSQATYRRRTGQKYKKYLLENLFARKISQCSTTTHYNNENNHSECYHLPTLKQRYHLQTIQKKLVYATWN